MQFLRRTMEADFTTQLRMTISNTINIERLQIYSLSHLFPGPYAICVEDSLPKRLTSLTLGFPWYTMRKRFCESVLTPFTSLEHLSLQCSGHFRTDYSVDVEVTLPNLVFYHGPSLLLKSLAHGSQKLSSLTLEVFTPTELGDSLSDDQTLKHLNRIGSKDEGGRDVAMLSFLKIVCDTQEAANAALEFIPQVEHLSLLCTLPDWITHGRLPSHDNFNLDFLSRTPSLRIFSLQYVHSKQFLPWDTGSIAESLGEMNASLVEVNIYGNTYRKSITTTGKRYAVICCDSPSGLNVIRFDLS
ncbi:hypothetical protein FB446DRAFT_459841 [Lentinula raphanica]|nr:hypothetical protein FB446DRAFT_459841 [Lentinula raphanica]